MKTRILAALTLMVTLFVLMSQSGCTVTSSAENNTRLVQRQLDIEMRQLVEDIGVFWQLDHPSRLSKWHYKN